MGVEADLSELRAFVTDLGDIPGEVAVEVRGIVQHAMLNIKNRMIDDARSSPHFKALAGAMSYDTTIDAGGITGEAGPDREKSGAAGLLGAYYGWSQGGGTVADPIHALEAEVPAVEKFIGEAVEKAFRG